MPQVKIISHATQVVVLYNFQTADRQNLLYFCGFPNGHVCVLTLHFLRPDITDTMPIAFHASWFSLYSKGLFKWTIIDLQTI